MCCKYFVTNTSLLLEPFFLGEQQAIVLKAIVFFSFLIYVSFENFVEQKRSWVGKNIVKEEGHIKVSPKILIAQ